MNGLQNAINKTKEYAHRYGQSLNDKQLFLRLISPNIYPFSKLEKRTIGDSLDDECQRKITLAKKLVKQHLSKMKGIEMVGITGSVAVESVGKNEDIDLLIITKEDELWWWRLYLRFYVWWHNIPHRRFGEKERKDEFCFNLWLDRANLIIPKQKRNLKNATDLVVMKVIFDKNGCYQKFLRENGWVNTYLATGYNGLLKKENYNYKNENSYIKKILNMIIFAGQYLYMQSRQKQKLKNIRIGQAFFHKYD